MANVEDVMLSMNNDSEEKHCAWSMDKIVIKFYISIPNIAEKHIVMLAGEDGLLHWENIAPQMKISDHSWIGLVVQDLDLQILF